MLVFRNKAPRLDGSQKMYWSELPNLGFCLKTLGFPADPANFSGFVGMYVHNCTLYIYIYTVHCIHIWSVEKPRKPSQLADVGSFSYTSFSLPDVAVSLTSSFCP